MKINEKLAANIMTFLSLSFPILILQPYIAQQATEYKPWQEICLSFIRSCSSPTVSMLMEEEKKRKSKKNIFMKMEKKENFANSHICKLNGKSWWKVTKRTEMEIVYLTYFNNFFAFTFLFLFSCIVCEEISFSFLRFPREI